MTAIHSYTNFTYEPKDRAFLSEASTLGMEVGGFPQKIGIQGKRELVIFRYQTYRLDLDYAVYSGTAGDGQTYYAHIFND